MLVSFTEYLDIGSNMIDICVTGTCLLIAQVKIEGQVGVGKIDRWISGPVPDKVEVESTEQVAIAIIR